MRRSVVEVFIYILHRKSEQHHHHHHQSSGALYTADVTSNTHAVIIQAYITADGLLEKIIKSEQQ